MRINERIIQGNPEPRLALAILERSTPGPPAGRNLLLNNAALGEDARPQIRLFGGLLLATDYGSPAAGLERLLDNQIQAFQASRSAAQQLETTRYAVEVEPGCRIFHHVNLFKVRVENNDQPLIPVFGETLEVPLNEPSLNQLMLRMEELTRVVLDWYVDYTGARH